MTVTQEIAPFKPLPWQVTPWRDKSKVVLATGTAGGGKSRFGGEKIHAFMLKYPGAMGLMLRKNRQSMENSVILSMKYRVIGGDPRVRHLPSYHRFEYSNGSILAYGGMKDEEQREQIRSIGIDGALDFVLMEEANRFREDDFEELLFRMRGKAAPWFQILLLTNPDHPRHWINRRLILGKEAEVYYSSYENNPHNPPEYTEMIKRARGVRALRLGKGIWAPSEGVVFDGFNPEIHANGPDYDPALGGVIWFCDDGYAAGQGVGTESYHPRVILLAQETPVGGVNIFAEYYRTGVASYETSIDEVLGWGYPAPEVCYVDSAAAMFIGALRMKGFMALKATHEVEEGIKNVQRMLAEEVGGEPLLRVNARCTELIREFESYQRDPESGRLIKVDDHGPSCVRYGTWHKRWAA